MPRRRKRSLSRMLTLIREKTPDAQIYIQTVTPRAATSASLPSTREKRWPDV